MFMVFAKTEREREKAIDEEMLRQNEPKTRRVSDCKPAGHCINILASKLHLVQTHKLTLSVGVSLTVCLLKPGDWRPYEGRVRGAKMD